MSVGPRQLRASELAVSPLSRSPKLSSCRGAFASPSSPVFQVLDISALVCRVLWIPSVPSTKLIVRVGSFTIVSVGAFTFVVGILFWSREDSALARATLTGLELVLSFHCLTVNCVQVWKLTILVANSLEQL